ncbi:MAG: ADP-ribosylglycohydrolase family protein [Bacilli bacterium]|nr:ADP-ribosylglycohydrolase family protein [Bacilli bacterium]
MLGAIIGDVVGSYYEVLEIEERKNNKKNRSYEERIKILDENIPLFTDKCSATDDSILTCAIYDAIKNGNRDYEKYLKIYGIREINLGKDIYGRSRFGSGFVDWLEGKKEGNSFGNGSAMRISPVGFCFNTLEEVKEESKKATIPSHNHVNAIIASEAVATSIFLLRKGMSKEEVIKYIKDNYYDLNYDLETLQKNYSFSSKASNSVPQALYIFSIANSFEDSIRKAISIGGDTDTIAAIVGSLSESYYGIPENLKQRVKPYLKDYMYDLLKDKYYKKEKVREKKYETNN